MTKLISGVAEFKYENRFSPHPQPLYRYFSLKIVVTD
jgi:hypothetical protein